MKKLLNTLALTVVMIFAGSTFAFAAPVTPAQKLQAKLIQAGFPNTYIGNIVEHLQKIQITEAQSNKLLGLVDEAVVLLGDSKDISKLTAEDKDLIMNLAKEGGSSIGLNTSFGKDAKGVTTFTLTDASGKAILSLNTLDVKDMVTNVNVPQFKDALTEIVEFSNSPDKGKFDPISGSLNNTGTNAGTVVLSGVGLMTLAGIVFLRSKKVFA